MTSRLLLALPYFTVVVLIVLGLAVMLFGTPVAFGPNPGDLNTAGLLPLLNVGVGIEVLGGLTIILLYMLSGIKDKEKKP